MGLASEKMQLISGTGSGELLLNFTIHSTAPVYSGRYTCDLASIQIPPISSAFNVTITNEAGYSYLLPGVYIPGKPNNFTVSASKVKNLNIGLRKLQGSYENSSMVWKDRYTRTWITSQILPDKDSVATTTSDLLSPGSYQVKIFGDAAENVSQVNLTMALAKKIIVNGRFNIGINTTGFPAGDYSITAKALNGSFSLDEIKLEGSSIAD
jgi:hypothetical protein